MKTTQAQAGAQAVTARNADVMATNTRRRFLRFEVSMVLPPSVPAPCGPATPCIRRRYAGGCLFLDRVVAAQLAAGWPRARTAASSAKSGTVAGAVGPWPRERE